ncbi:MAG: hypothetical protein U0939_22470 [Pirellulales bacterium]
MEVGWVRKITPKLKGRALPEERAIGARDLSDHDLILFADPVFEVSVEYRQAKGVCFAAIDHLRMKRSRQVEQHGDNAASFLPQHDSVSA